MTCTATTDAPSTWTRPWLTREVITVGIPKTSWIREAIRRSSFHCFLNSARLEVSKVLIIERVCDNVLSPFNTRTALVFALDQ